MFKEITVFEIICKVVFWVSPLVVLVGLLLLILRREAYAKMESRLGREIGGIKKRILPFLEDHREGFFKWLLSRKNLVGLAFIIFGIAFFFMLRR